MVTVKYHLSLIDEITKTKSEEIEASTVGKLIEKLISKYGKISDYFGRAGFMESQNCIVVLNREDRGDPINIEDDSARVLYGSDIVHIFPIVGGG